MLVLLLGNKDLLHSLNSTCQVLASIVQSDDKLHGSHNFDGGMDKHAFRAQPRLTNWTGQWDAHMRSLRASACTFTASTLGRNLRSFWLIWFASTCCLQQWVVLTQSLRVDATTACGVEFIDSSDHCKHALLFMTVPRLTQRHW